MVFTLICHLQVGEENCRFLGFIVTFEKEGGGGRGIMVGVNYTHSGKNGRLETSDKELSTD